MGRGKRIKDNPVVLEPRATSGRKVIQRPSKIMNSITVNENIFNQEEYLKLISGKLDDLDKRQDSLLKDFDFYKREADTLGREFIRAVAQRIIENKDKETFDLLSERIDESMQIFKDKLLHDTNTVSTEYLARYPYHYYDKPTENRISRIIEPYVKWYNNLTGKEQSALEMYKSSGYVEVNRYCREGIDEYLKSSFFKDIPGSYAANQLTALFEKAPVTNEKTFVTRVVRISAMDFEIHGGKREDLIAKTKPGSVYTDKGFLSTTCTTERLSTTSKETMIMMLEAPAGSKMIPAHILATDLKDYEDEFIFPRNTEITITDRVEDKERDIIMVYGKLKTPTT